MTWIGACSCGSGMRCDTEAEVTAAAQDHLAAVKAAATVSPLSHAVSVAAASRTLALVPTWTTGGTVAATPPAVSPPASGSNGTAPRTLSPAEIMRAMAEWEIKFALEEDAAEDGGSSKPKYTNPYTTDLDEEDLPGWGGPGQPPGDDDDDDDEGDEQEATHPGELPEGITIAEPGADYTLDKRASPQPADEGGHGSQS